MADSNWKVRMMLFVRAVDNTPENRQAFAEIFANNGSGETVANESNLFNAVIRLSTSGALPAQVLGIESALLLPDMRADMQAFLDTLSLSRYYVTANYPLPSGAFFGKLLQDNKTDAGQPTLVDVPPWDTTPFFMADALADIYAERGLQVIPDA